MSNDTATPLATTVLVNVRRLVVDRNLGTLQLAAALGRSVGETLARLDGKTEFALEELPRLAELLGVGVDELANSPAPTTGTDVCNKDQGGRCPIFIPANWNPHYDDGVLYYADAESDGPVSSTWAYDEGFRYNIEDGPGELTTGQAWELLGQLGAARAASWAAGHRIAEGIVAELHGHRERIAPADLTIPDRDVDGTLLDFGLPAYGPVTTSWHPEDGFNYSIDHSLFLDPVSARGLQGALERVLRDNARAKRRMDDTVAAWHRGEDVHALMNPGRPR